MDFEIGQRLAARRRARGLSQEELAANLGVSRQAVSNWERAETAPDTDNLIALANLYGITLDELLNHEANTIAPDADAPNGAVPVPRNLKADAIAYVLAIALSVVFYYVVAPPLLFSTVDDITEIFGIGISPAMALTWILAEAIFVLVPYLLLAPIAALTRSRSRMLWVVPAAVLALSIGASVAWAAFAGAPAIEFSGIGGALASSVVIKTDVIASIAGCALAATIARRRRSDTNN
ncbi:MAG: hypothetical protein CVT59_02935 [Actinobacteria bacterium HGW-Actinobacteria-1]|jgi:transcriptional regulator with XRE-family HTH domain|nr:MAG: hypothetical protein CVT59_02935 [Actinobacteria bacterium HGW-Actinobacteria-1]